MPELSFVAPSDLALHEECQRDRIDRLIKRLKEDRVLRNPPVVARPSAGKKHVVLDGANRVRALQELGCRDILVQPIDYLNSDVQLESWYHLVVGPQTTDLLRELNRVKGVELNSMALTLAREQLRQWTILAYVVCPNGNIYGLSGGTDLMSKTVLLGGVVETYATEATIQRVRTDDIESLLPYYDDVTALVVFPKYHPEDILHMAGNGVKLPAGITRHVIPRRVLRVNVDLAVLEADLSIEEKNSWLQEWIKHKLANKEIRFYEESTWLFDE